MEYLVRPVAYDTFYFCFHICDVLVIVAYAVALILCLINLAVGIDKAHYLLVILRVLVAYATTLHHFERV